jgi:hypothetical protein
MMHGCCKIKISEGSTSRLCSYDGEGNKNSLVDIIQQKPIKGVRRECDPKIATGKKESKGHIRK